MSVCVYKEVRSWRDASVSEFTDRWFQQHHGQKLSSDLVSQQTVAQITMTSKNQAAAAAAVAGAQLSLRVSLFIHFISLTGEGCVAA